MKRVWIIAIVSVLVSFAGFAQAPSQTSLPSQPPLPQDLVIQPGGGYPYCDSINGKSCPRAGDWTYCRGWPGLEASCLCYGSPLKWICTSSGDVSVPVGVPTK
jgi:hypothetical protein